MIVVSFKLAHNSQIYAAFFLNIRKASLFSWIAVTVKFNNEQNLEVSDNSRCPEEQKIGTKN